MTPTVPFHWSLAAPAWGVILASSGPLGLLPVMCTGALITGLPSSAEVFYSLSWIPPEHLAASWVLMVVAMMLPLAGPALNHIRTRSLSRDQTRATAGFLLGYLGIWMLSGVVLVIVAILIIVVTPSPMVACALVLTPTLAWQVTRWKQKTLNACHARPPLSRYGQTPIGRSVGFGAAYSLWCVASCAPLMLAAMVISGQNPVWMLVAALWIWAERVEAPQKPAFGFRLPLRAVRAGLHQIRRLRVVA